MVALFVMPKSALGAFAAKLPCLQLRREIFVESGSRGPGGRAERTCGKVT